MWRASGPVGPIHSISSRREDIAKNQNTYAKRKREMDKKHKAQDKLERRAKRKESPPSVAGQPMSLSETDEPNATQDDLN